MVDTVVDPILLPISLVFFMATWVFCTYMMVFFTHPDDQNVAFFPKVIVVCILLIRHCLAIYKHY